MTIMTKRIPVVALAVFLAATISGSAHVQVSALFSDNMVLQQGVPVPVWGYAHEGDVVTVKFRGRSVSTTTHNLKWSVNLRALKASSVPETLTISSDDHTLTFTNVLVGEVWLCSGQSNMEWPLNQTTDPEAAVAGATNSLLRIFNVPNVKADAPLTKIKGAWKVCSPEVMKNLTAVGYYFGRDLQAARKVPVGLIQSDWGGSPAEAWMSREALEINGRYQSEILDGYLAAYKSYQEALAAFEKEKNEAKQNNREFKKNAPGAPFWKPTELYNGMIAPLVPFAIKGAIWYQGESNAGRAEQYRSLFVDMIRGWRRDWGTDFPFLCVQLAPFMEIKDQPQESGWAELREAQWLSTKVLPKAGMAVITDVGDPKDIHPKKKQPVGARLALAARAIAYGEKIEFSGPEYRNAEFKNGKAILHFDHVGKGLKAGDGELKGFAICGDDHKFVWAKAEIFGDTVVVSSPEITKPAAVRYGWADCPVVNLWNQDGLPATPFRTDDFSMVTAGKK